MPRPRVCAVSFLNTSPLVWGMLHGPQQGLFDLDFQVPSACADAVAEGRADIGIIPAYELLRQDVDIIPGTGIASYGPVRSILLVSSCPAQSIRTLAADTSSRTSVQLARVIHDNRYQCTPEFVPHAPDLEAMLQHADAALIIGDPALRIDPRLLPYQVYDLGAEWTELTGHPMVFAVWAARPGIATPDIVDAFRASYEYGRDHMEELVTREAAHRELAPDLVRRYLTHHIIHALGEREYAGMQLFLNMAAQVSSGKP